MREVNLVMGPEFYQTGYGKRFFDAQLPRLINAIERLAAAVEKQNETEGNELEKAKNGSLTSG